MAADERPELELEQLDTPAALRSAGISYIIGSGRHRDYVVASCPCCDNTTLRVPKRRGRSLAASCEDGCTLADIVREISALREQLREPSWFPAAGPVRDRTLGDCIEREIAPLVRSEVESALELQDAQRASLEQDPEWRAMCDEMRARGLSPDDNAALWHSKETLHDGYRLQAMERLLDAGRELHPRQRREVLVARRRRVEGARRAADRYRRDSLNRDGLFDEIAARDQQAYKAALRACRLQCSHPPRRGGLALRGGGRPRARRGPRAQARAPGDDGDGSEPPGAVGAGRTKHAALKGQGSA